MGKSAFVILMMIIVAFAVILWATGLVGAQFGTVGEIAALSAVAVVLFIGYIKSKGEK